MKRNIKISLMIVALVAAACVSYAQKTIKLGHVNSTEILEATPGRDTAIKELQKYQAELEETFKDLYDEYQVKFKKYQAEVSAYSDSKRAIEEQSLADLQKRIQDFQGYAQKQMEEKEKTVFDPIINKIKKAIEEVAKENKFTYVFDASVGVLLYADESEDIMPLVKKKLGLK